MQRHRITSIRPLRIISQARVIDRLPSIVRAGIIIKNIELCHTIGPVSPVDAHVVLGPGYLDAAMALAKVLRWAGLLRTDAVVVGCDAGIGIMVVFAGGEGGGHGESAGAQSEEEE